jgi:hypothetical protein
MPIEPDPIETVPGAEAPPGRPWYSRLFAVCFAIFCFEMGVFLVVFPWLGAWQINRVATYSPWLGSVWGNPFFRGAFSGLGLVNIYISFWETLGLFRDKLTRR